MVWYPWQFCKYESDATLDHNIPFGCPVHVLDPRLQQIKKIDKLQQRSRVGVYLVQSMNHAKTVCLVLSIKTGLVSPQNHVQFDSYFETTRWKEYLPNVAS